MPHGKRERILPKERFHLPRVIFDEYSEDWVNALISKKMTNMNKGKNAETARHFCLSSMISWRMPISTNHPL
jgi:hypothetical protein